jgi:hypothetical protein
MTDCPLCDRDHVARIGPLKPDVSQYDVSGPATVHLGELDGQRFAWVHQRQTDLADFC